jgi:dihydrofolate synthase/folylpolyglutamate synthase
VENAAMVMAACELLNKKGMAIDENKIRSGLARHQWPGRLELVSAEPTIILDGAHNYMAAKNLSRFLAESFPDRPINLVVGILDDKPYQAMLKFLLPVCNRAIFTRPVIDRAISPETLYRAGKDLIAESEIVSGVESAVDRAIQTATPETVICIAGSLYMVGDAKIALSRRNDLKPPIPMAG